MDSLDLVSTGAVEIRPQHRRSDGSPLLWWLFTSRRWTQPLPITVGVVRHAGAVVLFDLGQDRASVTDPHYFPDGFARVIYRRLARFEISAAETLPALLGGLGIRPEEVTHAVVSHLHQDHIGGLGDLPNATVFVSADEWRWLERSHSSAGGLLHEHIELPGLNWQQVAFDEPLAAGLAPFTKGHDLLGDGSLLLLPLPGHTPGSMGMLARVPGQPPVLFVGDLTYDATLLGTAIPGSGKPAGLRAASKAVLELRDRIPGLVVVGAHDPGAAAALAHARRETMAG